MASEVKYLVTLDQPTGSTIKVERLGSGGELVAVPASTPEWTTAAAPTPGPQVPQAQEPVDPGPETEEPDGPRPEGPRPEEPPPPDSPP